MAWFAQRRRASRWQRLCPVFVGGGGYFFGFSPVLVMGPGGFLPPLASMGPSFLPARAPLMPPPPPGFLAPNGGLAANKAKPKPSDSVRSGQLTTLGDRLFRAGNLKKSEERYLQAMRTAPDLAAPRVRLAQIALAKGHFADAATRLREAETAQPGWIINAPDIQTIYGEPTEFARSLARVESYLQANPDDRDGWLVLGAQLFLSGRTTKAADVFRRLDDPNRKSDVAPGGLPRCVQPSCAAAARQRARPQRLSTVEAAAVETSGRPLSRSRAMSWPSLVELTCPLSTAITPPPVRPICLVRETAMKSKRG